MGSTAWLQVIGLGSIWVPILVSFLFVPVLYLQMAADAHKEYNEAVKFAISRQSTKGKVTSAKGRIPLVDDHLAVFQLDVWLVGAFSVLIASIVGCGLLMSSTHIGSLEPKSSGSGLIQVAMSVYATIVALTVALRLVWARMALTRGITHFYSSFLKSP